MSIPGNRFRAPEVMERVRTFGQVVKRRRLSLGLSQQELAQRAGWDRQSVNRLERTRHLPSLARLYQLADALGVPLRELFAQVDRQLFVVADGDEGEGGSAEIGLPRPAAGDPDS